jgi:FAD/FMN-containing dehydrogenase
MAAPWLTTEDINWNLERAVFNILVDQQPAGIARPRSADEVSEVVRSAAADGKRVAAQRTGHNAAPLGSLANTVLLRTAGLGGVQVDADAGIARVGAGPRRLRGSRICICIRRRRCPTPARRC